MFSAFNRSNSGRDLPSIHSVSAEPLAIAAVHPRTLYFASATRPLSNRADKRKISPHTGFSICTVTAGASSSPTLRGFLK